MNEVDHFIRQFGMKRLLEEMIANTTAARDEKPDQGYLDTLVKDLTTALKNYEGRYARDTDEEAT